MPSSCVFEFDRPDPVFYSGETINGRIQLTTTSQKSVRSVYISFIGKAKVHWSESRSRTRNGKTEHYTEHFRAEEIYIDSRTNVFGDGQLPVGLHTYTFCIPLPVQCPTSCVESYGHIKYELRLVVDRPYTFDNEFHQPVTVIKQLNLNLSPELLIPVQSEDVKYFCCWPCSSGPVHCTLTIPFGGYAPGQKIKYTLTVDNQSHKYDLQGLELKLKQIYEFVAHFPRHKTREENNTLASVQQEQNCLRLSKRVFEGELLIPPVPPSSSDCGIITVSYQVKMTVDCGSCHTDSDMIIPIKIGTVPLIQSASDPSHAAWIQPIPVQPASAPDMTPDALDSDKPPAYDLYKPPSFEEATTIGGKFIDPDVDERHRSDGFIPKYPMYSNFAVPSAPPTTLINDVESAPLIAHQQNQSSSQPFIPSGIGSLPYPTGPTIGMPTPGMPPIPMGVPDASTTIGWTN